MKNRKTLKCKCQSFTKPNSREKKSMSCNKSTLQTLIYKNNILEQQNYNLKNQSLFLNPVSFLKSTVPYKQNNCLVLQDKLFNANRTLQETIMSLDAQSESNRVLKLKVSEQELQIKRLQHQRNNLLDEIDKYRFKFQKYMTIGKNSSISKIQSRIKGTIDYNDDIFQKYNKLLEAHSNLQQKYQTLQEQVSAQNLLQKANMKMNLIQRNITKMQQNNQQLIQNLSEQYIRFKSDAIEYFSNISNQLKFLTSLNYNQTKSYNFAKQQTYRNIEFKQIANKYNIPKMIVDLLNLVYEYIEEETNNHQLVVEQMLGKLENKFSDLTQKYVSITKIVQKPKSKVKKFSHHNNQNLNTSNRLQNSFN